MDKKRILVIDDEPSFTRGVRLNLEAGGHFEVKEVNNPLEALIVAHGFKPHLVLLDVVMPGLDGGDVASRLKADRALKDVPIIFLTATVTPTEAGRGGLMSGGDLFLAKPFNTDDLIRCIDAHIKTQPGEVPPPPAAAV